MEDNALLKVSHSIPPDLNSRQFAFANRCARDTINKLVKGEDGIVLSELEGALRLLVWSWIMTTRNFLRKYWRDNKKKRANEPTSYRLLVDRIVNVKALEQILLHDYRKTRKFVKINAKPRIRRGLQVPWNPPSQLNLIMLPQDSFSNGIQILLREIFEPLYYLQIILLSKHKEITLPNKLHTLSSLVLPYFFTPRVALPQPEKTPAWNFNEPSKAMQAYNETDSVFLAIDSNDLENTLGWIKQNMPGGGRCTTMRNNQAIHLVHTDKQGFIGNEDLKLDHLRPRYQIWLKRGCRSVPLAIQVLLKHPETGQRMIEVSKTHHPNLVKDIETIMLIQQIVQANSKSEDTNSVLSLWQVLKYHYESIRHVDKRGKPWKICISKDNTRIDRTEMRVLSKLLIGKCLGDRVVSLIISLSDDRTRMKAIRFLRQYILSKAALNVITLLMFLDEKCCTQKARTTYSLYYKLHQLNKLDLHQFKSSYDPQPTCYSFDLHRSEPDTDSQPLTFLIFDFISQLSAIVPYSDDHLDYISVSSIQANAISLCSKFISSLSSLEDYDSSIAKAVDMFKYRDEYLISSKGLHWLSYNSSSLQACLSNDPAEWGNSVLPHITAQSVQKVGDAKESFEARTVMKLILQNRLEYIVGPNGKYLQIKKSTFDDLWNILRDKIRVLMPVMKHSNFIRGGFFREKFEQWVMIVTRKIRTELRTPVSKQRSKQLQSAKRSTWWLTHYCISSWIAVSTQKYDSWYLNLEEMYNIMGSKVWYHIKESVELWEYISYKKSYSPSRTKFDFILLIKAFKLKCQKAIPNLHKTTREVNGLLAEVLLILKGPSRDLFVKSLGQHCPSMLYLAKPSIGLKVEADSKPFVLLRSVLWNFYKEKSLLQEKNLAELVYCIVTNAMMEKHWNIQKKILEIELKGCVIPESIKRDCLFYREEYKAKCLKVVGTKNDRANDSKIEEDPIAKLADQPDSYGKFVKAQIEHRSSLLFLQKPKPNLKSVSEFVRRLVKNKKLTDLKKTIEFLLKRDDRLVLSTVMMFTEFDPTSDETEVFIPAPLSTFDLMYLQDRLFWMDQTQLRLRFDLSKGCLEFCNYLKLPLPGEKLQSMSLPPKKPKHDYTETILLQLLDSVSPTIVESTVLPFHQIPRIVKALIDCGHSFWIGKVIEYLSEMHETPFSSRESWEINWSTVLLGLIEFSVEEYLGEPAIKIKNLSRTSRISQACLAQIYRNSNLSMSTTISEEEDKVFAKLSDLLYPEYLKYLESKTELWFDEPQPKYDFRPLSSLLPFLVPKEICILSEYDIIELIPAEYSPRVLAISGDLVLVTEKPLPMPSDKLETKLREIIQGEKQSDWFIQNNKRMNLNHAKFYGQHLKPNFRKKLTTTEAKELQKSGGKEVEIHYDTRLNWIATFFSSKYSLPEKKEEDDHLQMILDSYPLLKSKFKEARRLWIDLDASSSQTHACLPILEPCTCMDLIIEKTGGISRFEAQTRLELSSDDYEKFLKWKNSFVNFVEALFCIKFDKRFEMKQVEGRDADDFYSGNSTLQVLRFSDVREKLEVTQQEGKFTIPVIIEASRNYINDTSTYRIDYCCFERLQIMVLVDFPPLPPHGLLEKISSGCTDTSMGASLTENPVCIDDWENSWVCRVAVSKSFRRIGSRKLEKELLNFEKKLQTLPLKFYQRILQESDEAIVKLKTRKVRANPGFTFLLTLYEYVHLYSGSTLSSLLPLDSITKRTEPMFGIHHPLLLTVVSPVKQIQHLVRYPTGFGPVDLVDLREESHHYFKSIKQDRNFKKGFPMLRTRSGKVVRILIEGQNLEQLDLKMITKKEFECVNQNGPHRLFGYRVPQYLETTSSGRIFLKVECCSKMSGWFSLSRGGSSDPLIQIYVAPDEKIDRSKCIFIETENTKYRAPLLQQISETAFVLTPESNLGYQLLESQSFYRHTCDLESLSGLFQTTAEIQNSNCLLSINVVLHDKFWNPAEKIFQNFLCSTPEEPNEFIPKDYLDSLVMSVEPELIHPPNIYRLKIQLKSTLEDSIWQGKRLVLRISLEGAEFFVFSVRLKKVEFYDRVKKFRAEVLSSQQFGSTLSICVERRRLLESVATASKACMAHRRAVHFKGEKAIDIGGPSREFYDLLGDEIASGKKGTWLFKPNLSNHAYSEEELKVLSRGMSADLYLRIGLLIGNSLRQGYFLGIKPNRLLTEVLFLQDASKNTISQLARSELKITVSQTLPAIISECLLSLNTGFRDSMISAKNFFNYFDNTSIEYFFTGSNNNNNQVTPESFLDILQFSGPEAQISLFVNQFRLLPPEDCIAFWKGLTGSSVIDHATKERANIDLHTRLTPWQKDVVVHTCSKSADIGYCASAEDMRMALDAIVDCGRHGGGFNIG